MNHRYAKLTNNDILCRLFVLITLDITYELHT